MSSGNSEAGIKKIYEKSVKLLNDSQAQLTEMRKILKKAVIRLAFTSRSNDNKVNNILNDIKASVNNRIDLNNLDRQLDDLFVLINHSDHHHTSSGLHDDRSASDDRSLQINAVLMDIVNQLALPGEAKQQQTGLLKELDGPIEGDGSRHNLIEKIVLLVNQSISTIQLEKRDLESFINKINNQLAEIKPFVYLISQDHEESLTRSSVLQQSVESSVDCIHETVSSANDINDLKKGIAVHLKQIRKHVEENKHAEQLKDKASVQSFANIVNELNSIQEESNKLKQQLQESKSQLLRDTLTGLYNRPAYEDRVVVEFNRWKRNKTPLSLAMWDIDYFKSVNDNYGHDAGDRVLKLFSKIIQTRIRKTDMFARIGGEEFVLLMPETSIDIALALNDELREMIKKSNFHYNGKHCPVTASVGIAEFHQDDEPEHVLKRADQALYQSKNAGRDCCTAHKEGVVI